MNVTQLHTLINAVTKEVLGETGIVQEDLSNVVDIGKTIVDSNNVDNYVKKLVNHIGKVVFVTRPYMGGVPSVLMDSWEFGSILQKIQADLPVATENESWDLTDGESYDPNVFYQPTVEAKFFNSKVTFEIPLSFTEKQVKESFSSAEQLNGFVSMLVNSVDNAMTVKVDSLIMRTINNFIGETVYDGLYDDTASAIDATVTSGKAINLLKLYNETADTPITRENALSDPDFIRFATYQIGLVSSRMERMSELFNIKAKARFTPESDRVTVLLADFAKASNTFLASNTFNKELVALPKHDIVPFWQGSGTSYAFDDVSTIDIKTASEDIVNFSGIIGVMFDRNALGVTNLDKRVTTNYNPKAEFYTNFYKFDAGYFNDLSENFVVFFIGEDETP